MVKDIDYKNNNSEWSRKYAKTDYFMLVKSYYFSFLLKILAKSLRKMSEMKNLETIRNPWDKTFHSWIIFSRINTKNRHIWGIIKVKNQLFGILWFILMRSNLVPSF